MENILSILIERKCIPLSELDEKTVRKLTRSGFAKVSGNFLYPTEALLEAFSEEKFYGKKGLVLLSPAGVFFTKSRFGRSFLRKYFIVVEGWLEGESPTLLPPASALVLEAEESFLKGNYGLAKAKLLQAAELARNKALREKVEKTLSSSDLKEVLEEFKKRLGLREEQF